VSESFLVLGDQLSTDVAPWDDLSRETVIVMIESAALVERPRHLTRVALYLSSMRHFARRVEEMGFRVDYRRARDFSTGLREHRDDFSPSLVRMNAPEVDGRANSSKDSVSRFSPIPSTSPTSKS
jgi:deoxyribodipyrimidine photolyase-like uncharacterized protein